MKASIGSLVRREMAGTVHSGLKMLKEAHELVQDAHKRGREGKSAGERLNIDYQVETTQHRTVLLFD